MGSTESAREQIASAFNLSEGEYAKKVLLYPEDDELIFVYRYIIEKINEKIGEMFKKQ
jgi:hypothetical protein